MISLSLTEAQLFRQLVTVFGDERVIPHMSVLAVCGGALPEGIPEEITTWAKTSKCLFTVVDAEDEPKLVVEFFSGFEQGIDVTEEAHQRVLPHLLPRCGIRYVTVSIEEFVDALDPETESTVADLITGKLS
jgi:hypothetical protein